MGIFAANVNPFSSPVPNYFAFNSYSYGGRNYTAATYPGAVVSNPRSTTPGVDWAAIQTARTAGAWAGAFGVTVQPFELAPRGASIGASRSNFGQLYSKFFGNQYVSVVEIGKAAQALGVVGMSVGVLADTYQLYAGDDQMSGWKYTEHRIVDGIALRGGLAGLGVAAGYYSAETWYRPAGRPGGFDGLVMDIGRAHANEQARMATMGYPYAAYGF